MTATAPDTVLFVSVSRGMGGPARSLLTVLRHLDGRVRAVLAAPTGSLASAATTEGLVVEHLVLPHRDIDRRRSRLDAARVLDRAVRDRRDRLLALHANGQTELNLTALAHRRTGVPVVAWAHTSRASPTAGVLSAWWRRQVGVRWLAVSDVAAEVLADTLHLDAGSIGIVGNPVDPDDVVGERVPHDGIRVGYLGLAAPHKGFGLLGPVMTGLDRSDITLELFVAPPPSSLPLELRPPWDALAALEERRTVFLQGRTNDVARAYAELDVVLCPSRQESFGRIAAEAMCNGLPVVASDIRAFRQVVGHEEGGLLFPLDDADAARAAIVRLADDQQLRERLGEQARQRVERFAPAPVVEALLAAYGAG